MTEKFIFTIKALDALPIPEHGKRAEYWDETRPGLQIRITHTGARTFYVKHRVAGGEVERVKIGTYPKMKIEQARKDAASIVAAMANGKSVTTVARAGKEEATLETLFEDFITHRRNKRGAYLTEVTKRDYLSTFNLHFAKLRSRQLSKIKDSEIANLHTKVGKEHPTRANRIVALASSLYSHAKERKLFAGPNPAAGIKKFPENTRDRFIQADELPRFFEAVAAENNVTIRDYVLVSLLTGARRSNVLAMRWQDVNLDRAEWRIPMTKNGTPQTVTLSPEVVEILATRKPEKETENDKVTVFVFPGPGESGHLAEPGKGWQRILKAAGIDNLRIHDLRRTLGSWQAKSGASLSIIGKSLNHKSTSTTAIYARLDLDPVRESVNRASSAITAAGIRQTNNVVSLIPKKA